MCPSFSKATENMEYVIPSVEEFDVEQYKKFTKIARVQAKESWIWVNVFGVARAEQHFVD